ncbi:MAG TPA: alanine dehydrogenase [Alphaproteobacteria bacterium]|nr:alanine dehydrogenase [Alphaproteobacteria bacterium]
MLVGVPREIKPQEFRVGMVPAAVREFVAHGHEVLVERDAGAGIGASDDDYRAAGARIAETAEEVFAAAGMIVKVKEPQPGECAMLREGQVLFTYLHLAADRKQADGLLASGCVAIAYETVTGPGGGLPLLAPMSEIAGRMAPQVGANCLKRDEGGRGVLIGGAPGIEPASVVILGGGVAGTSAARIAIGMGARVTILEKSPARIRWLEDRFAGQAGVVYSMRDAIERYVSEADMVIGAVLLPGAAAPKLVGRELLASMAQGAVIVDVAIDQGGCFDTSRPTTHAEPTYVVDGVVHYCVANMPGAFPRTSAFALNHAVLPYGLALAGKGWRAVLADDPHLRAGLNVCHGKITSREVAESLDLSFVPSKELAA